MVLHALPCFNQFQPSNAFFVIIGMSFLEETQSPTKEKAGGANVIELVEATYRLTMQFTYYAARQKVTSPVAVTMTELKLR